MNRACLMLLVMAVVLLWTPLDARGQTGTIMGQVVHETTGETMTGVQVQVRGTSIGGLTNESGRYLLNGVPAGEHTVEAVYIGYGTARETVTVAAGATSTVNFRLGETALAVEGIVVTALGMERQARTLGVSTQQIVSEDLTRAEVNVVNSLSGKVAGVSITNSGPQGGSTRMVIRGENSVTGDNQPLFVVDGVPMDNSVGGRQGVLADQGGFDYGNAIQDLNPDAIQSITVLKGPNAAALYGSRAGNGVVVIETKKGRSIPGGKQADIVVSQIVTFEDELRLPDYQNKYGQGYAGQFAYYDGFGNGTYDDWDESWGPPLDAGLMIPQWNGPIDPETGERVPTPWVSHPSNIDDFFDVGTTLTTNVSVATATDRLHARAGFSRTNLDGMVPGFKLERTSVTFAGGMEATDKLDIQTSLQYVTADGENRPGVGYGEDNPMSQFIWFGRQVDVKQLKQLYDVNRPADDPMAGLPYSWNYSFHPNPYFLQLANSNNDGRDRLIGSLAATYAPTPWLKAMVRAGTDWYQDSRLKSYAYAPQIDYSGFYTTNPTTGGREFVSVNGGFGEWGIGYQETNTEFLLTATPQLSLPVTTTLVFGGNRRDWERTSDYTWVGELATPGIFDISNSAGAPDRNTLFQQKRVNSLYGQAELGYQDYLFLNLTGRNDWSSTLPEANRSYFYPSVSGSLVFSELLPSLDTRMLSFGKLRASWARVGNDTNPYALRNTFLADEIWDGTPSFSVPGVLANASLKPETTESIEVGTELAFLNNRLGLDVTYYTQETRDQIMPVQLSRSTGYTGRIINAGTVENKGWELLLRGTPVVQNDFRWETTFTWAKNDNKVVSLAEGVEGLEISNGDFWGVSLYARTGEPLGQLVGSAYQRDPNGNIVVSKGVGVPLWTNAPQVIGNVNPDWRAGWSNQFSYKGARLQFLFDMRQGGDIFSVTNLFGRYGGILEETVAGRCTPADALEPGEQPPVGYPVCTPETGIVFDGVNRVIGEDGDTTYVQNETVVDATTFWEYAYNVREAHLEDASYIKLREVSFSYDVPETWAKRVRMSGLQLSVIGRNLYLWADAKHIDPETSLEGSNVQGFEYGQMPSTRSIGFNITVRP